MRKRLYCSALWVGCLAIVTCLGLGFARLMAPPRPGPPQKADTLPLDEAERQFLWDVEHHGQLLSQRGFKAISQALRQADTKALRALLADNFEGATLRQPREITLPGDFVHVVRQEDQGHPPEPLTRDEVVARL